MLKIFTSNECIFPLLSFISINIVGSKTLFRTLKKTYSMVYQQQGDNHTQVKYLIVKQESICLILYYTNISPPPPHILSEYHAHLTLILSVSETNTSTRKTGTT